MRVLIVTIAYWALTGLCGIAALFWVLVSIGTFVEHRRQRWVVKTSTALPPPPRTPRVTVLIPARNEERNLRTCLDAVRALEWPDLQILLIDDRSTDATPRIAAEAAAADPRVTVLGGSDLPEGWMGKSWALHQAVPRATGEWLLFLDADVTVHPRALSQAFAYAAAEKAAMFSGYGTLVLGTFWEKVIMPVIGGMIVGGNPLREVNDPEHFRVVCNGQFILVSRMAYDAIGGHAAIRSEIIDDVAMAREVKAKKLGYRMVFCRELFSTRMYTGFGEIWRGWRKNIYAGLRYRPHVAFVVVAFVWVTAVIPLGVAIGRAAAMRGEVDLRDPLLAASAAASVLMFVYRVYSARIFEQPWGLFWTHPLGAILVSGIFLDSALRGLFGGTVDWKGRAYAASGSAPPGK